jgi:hypothetical protein
VPVLERVLTVETRSLIELCGELGDKTRGKVVFSGYGAGRLTEGPYDIALKVCGGEPLDVVSLSELGSGISEDRVTLAMFATVNFQSTLG